MIIRTEADYHYTRNLLAEWEGKIRDLRTNPPSNMTAERVEGECGAMEYTAGEFKQQLAEYEAISDGRFDPEALRRSEWRLTQARFAFAHDLLVARLSSDVTEDEMAWHLGISIDELRELEDNEYRSADMDTLKRAADRLTGGVEALRERLGMGTERPVHRRREGGSSRRAAAM